MAEAIIEMIVNLRKNYVLYGRQKKNNLKQRQGIDNEKQLWRLREPGGLDFWCFYRT